jgi:hypothetical protein
LLYIYYFYRVIVELSTIIAELFTSQCEGVFTVVARDCEQAVEHGDFESFISAPIKTS